MELGHMQEGKESLERKQLVKSRRSEGALCRLVSPAPGWCLGFGCGGVRSSVQKCGQGHLLASFGLWAFDLWGLPEGCQEPWSGQLLHPVFPICPVSELISFSQIVCHCRQGLCYPMPYKCHLKATSNVSPSRTIPSGCGGQLGLTCQLPVLILHLPLPWSQILGYLTLGAEAILSLSFLLGFMEVMTFILQL